MSLLTWNYVPADPGVWLFAGKCSYTYISSTISMYSTPAPELPIDRMKSSLRPVNEDTVVTDIYKDDDERYSLQKLLSRQEEGER